MERAHLRAHAALLFMVVVWAVNFSVSKRALGELEPLAFNALRFPLAALLLYVILRRRGPIPAPQRADLPRVWALGILGNLVYQLCFIVGLDRTSAGNASLLLASSPIMTALLSAYFGHERVRARVWIGVAATFAGIVLVVLGGRSAEAAASSITGDIIMFIAAVAWACYTVGSRPLIERYGPVPVTAWTLWIGAAGLVLAGIPATLQTDFSNVSPASWFAVFYAGVLSIGVAYVIWYYGVEQLGNTRTSTYSNVVPVIALAVAWLWLGEAPTAAQMAGAAVIVGGVTLAQSS